uniref:Uncharacterized protein n=1 Tax=mine drainage metagenome TaxID=410659 RepID=E6QCG0_9ZZZZ
MMRMPATAAVLVTHWLAYPDHKGVGLLLAEGSDAARDGFSCSSQSLVRVAWVGVQSPSVSHQPRAPPE